MFFKSIKEFTNHDRDKANENQKEYLKIFEKKYIEVAAHTNEFTFFWHKIEWKHQIKTFLKQTRKRFEQNT